MRQELDGVAGLLVFEEVEHRRRLARDGDRRVGEPVGDVGDGHVLMRQLQGEWVRLDLGTYPDCPLRQSLQRTRARVHAVVGHVRLRR